MKSIETPLLDLRERIIRFISSREIRLFHVSVDETMWMPAVLALTCFSYHPSSQDILYSLENPDARRPARCWEERAALIRSTHGALASSLGIAASMADELPLPTTAAEDERDAFAATLAAAGKAIRASRLPFRNITAVLAPPTAELGAALAEDLRAFLRDPRLRDIRWAWIEQGDSGKALAAELGDDALHATCVRDLRVWADDFWDVVHRVVGFEAKPFVHAEMVRV